MSLACQLQSQQGVIWSKGEGDVEKSFSYKQCLAMYSVLENTLSILF